VSGRESVSSGVENHSLLIELERIFKGHRADLGRPLSPANYEVWRQSVQGGPEELFERYLPNGEKAITLKSSARGPFALNAIVSAALTVRQRDWHTVEQQIQVQDQDGIVHYTMGELASDVVALNRLPSSLFSDRAPEPPALVLPTPPHLLLPVQTEPTPVTEADLLATEVEVRYALHSTGVCVGRPISTARVLPDIIEVEGVVETEESKVRVMAALRGIPHLRCRIQTAAESDRSSSAQADSKFDNEAGVPQNVASEEISNPRLAAEDLLRDYFAANECKEFAPDERNRCVQRHIATLSQSALTASEAALTQAWALRQLCEAYSPSKGGAKLRTSARRLVQLMVEDHLHGLKVSSQHLHTALEPFLIWMSADVRPVTREVAGGAGDPGSPDWSETVLRLCREVEQTMNLALEMFVETNRPAMNQSHASLRRLSSSLVDLRNRVTASENSLDNGLAETLRLGSLRPSRSKEKTHLPSVLRSP